VSVGIGEGCGGFVGHSGEEGGHFLLFVMLCWGSDYACCWVLSGVLGVEMMVVGASITTWLGLVRALLFLYYLHPLV
jgi:hypothetical protein